MFCARQPETQLQLSKYKVRICREIYSCAKGGSFNLIFRKTVHTFSSPFPTSLLIPVPLNSRGIKSLELIFNPLVPSCLKFFPSWMHGAKQGSWDDVAERADLVSHEDKSVMLVLDILVFQVKELYVTSRLSSREFHSDSIENWQNLTVLKEEAN